MGRPPPPQQRTTPVKTELIQNMPRKHRTRRGSPRPAFQSWRCQRRGDVRALFPRRKLRRVPPWGAVRTRGGWVFLGMHRSSPVPLLPPGTQTDARDESVTGEEVGMQHEPCHNAGVDAADTDGGLGKTSASSNPRGRPSPVGSAAKATQSAGAETCAVASKSSAATFLSSCLVCARVAGGDPGSPRFFLPSVISPPDGRVHLIRQVQATAVRRLQTRPLVTGATVKGFDRISEVTVECV